MTVAEAEALLRAVKYWHYPIELPWGTTVPSRPGVDPERHLRRKRHFFDRLVSSYSGSLKGKTVLDLGCCQGFWSFHASRAGAARCLGIDSSETFVNEARAIAVVSGIDNCEFRCRHLETDAWDSEENRFDITLMLGLFYHLLDPIAVLRKAAAMTVETLVVDTVITEGDGSFLRLVPRDPDEPTTSGSNVCSMLRAVPTKQALLSLIADVGFKKMDCIQPDAETPQDYLRGQRMSVIARR